jgi:hypothetical protein
MGFVFADQVPQAQHEVVRSNIGTKGLFRLGDEAAVNAFKALMQLNERQRAAILTMPDRFLLLSRPDIPFPFVTRVPDVYSGSGELRFDRFAGQGELENCRRATLEALDEAMAPARPEASPTAERTSVALSADLRAYLKLLFDRVGIPATKRDAEAGIPAAKGSRYRAKLKALGLVEEFQVNPGHHGGSFKDFRLTEKGRKALDPLETEK